MSKKTTEETSSDTKVNDTSSAQKKMCGVIMPIANTAGYELGHWKDVLNIIEDALKESEFEAKLVSERIDIGLIHEQIVTNIYENEIVICDVSSKNPNVMFELGMRLAFDKPTIIIKDELTNYSFDIGGILHLEYPSSLRHNKIENFKHDLRRHVEATYKRSKTENEYSPFLKSFGRNIIAKSITNSEISESQFIIDKLNKIEQKLRVDNNQIINNYGRVRTGKQLTSYSHFSAIDDKTKDRIFPYLLNFYPQDFLDDKVENGFPVTLLTELKNLIEKEFSIQLSEDMIFSLIVERINSTYDK
ncbi:hypothetical protein [Flectobacillus roseus]|uniref:hypothetical protein n=1 Tax=Flectobacillus roseus TaxID=502259 RepID=UPI0024B84C53|nr:hypothetical protein [Flectobacillus roseus]MDI9870023.1 hypothetical protein [Flectobacillus roseus]